MNMNKENNIFPASLQQILSLKEIFTKFVLTYYNCLDSYALKAVNKSNKSHVKGVSNQKSHNLLPFWMSKNEFFCKHIIHFCIVGHVENGAFLKFEIESPNYWQCWWNEWDLTCSNCFRWTGCFIFGSGWGQAWAMSQGQSSNIGSSIVSHHQLISGQSNKKTIRRGSGWH